MGKLSLLPSEGLLKIKLKKKRRLIEKTYKVINVPGGETPSDYHAMGYKWLHVLLLREK